MTCATAFIMHRLSSYLVSQLLPLSSQLPNCTEFLNSSNYYSIGSVQMVPLLGWLFLSSLPCVLYFHDNEVFTLYVFCFYLFTVLTDSLVTSGKMMAINLTKKLKSNLLEVLVWRKKFHQTDIIKYTFQFNVYILISFLSF